MSDDFRSPTNTSVGAQPPAATDMDRQPRPHQTSTNGVRHDRIGSGSLFGALGVGARRMTSIGPKSAYARYACVRFAWPLPCEEVSGLPPWAAP